MYALRRRTHARTHTRKHAQHSPQSQKHIFYFQKESSLGTLRFLGGGFTAVIIQKDTAFWNVLPCSLVQTYRNVRGKSLYFHKTRRRQVSLSTCSSSITNFKPQDGPPKLYQTKQSVRGARWPAAVYVCL